VSPVEKVASVRDTHEDDDDDDDDDDEEEEEGEEEHCSTLFSEADSPAPSIETSSRTEWSCVVALISCRYQG
jgi:hypothetical protein